MIPLTAIVMTAPCLAAPAVLSGERQAAAAALAAGRFDEAAVLLRKLLSQQAEDAGLWQDLARAEEGAGRTDAALEAWTQALALQPGNTTAAAGAGRMLAAREDWNRVVLLLEPLAESARTADLEHLLGQAQRRLGRAREAAWHYTRAVRLDPQRFEDHLQLAELHLEQRAPAAAVGVLEEARALRPNDAGVEFLLARAYHQAGRSLGRIEIVPLPEAIPETTSGRWYVMEPSPDQPGRFVVCPQNSGIYHLQRAFELGADAPAVHLLHADIWFDAGRYEKARKIYEAIEPLLGAADLPGYHERFGRTLLALDDLDGFENHMLQAVELAPKTYKPMLGDAYQELAQRYCLRGDIEQYISCLERAVKEHPESAALRYKLGNACAEARRMPQAREAWFKTLELDPQHPDKERLLELLKQGE